MKILYVLHRFPATMESYVLAEIAEHMKRHDVVLVSLQTVPAQHIDVDWPYTLVGSDDELDEVIRAEQPDVLHTHFFETMEIIHAAALRHGIPYTVRTHAYDIAGPRFPQRFPEFASLARHPLCRGVLVFPYIRDALIDAGFPPEKLVKTGPVFWFERFHNEAPREPTGKMLAVGSAWPKKNFEALIDIAPRLKNITIDLYAAGGRLDDLKALNEERGSPISIRGMLPYWEMPSVYRDYDWYIYTGNTDESGLPVSILEAQASGIGVLHQYNRPDDDRFLGGAGFVYRDLEEIIDIVAQPYPEEMRRAGFLNAGRWDYRLHSGDIGSVWYDIENGHAAARRSLLRGIVDRLRAEPPFFVITMRRNLDRYLHVREALLPKLPRAEIVDGVDPATADVLGMAVDRGIKANPASFEAAWPAKLACTLSHLSVWQMIVDRGLPYGVILEDDASVDDRFAEFVKKLIPQIPEDADIVQLYVHPHFEAEWTAASEASSGPLVDFFSPWGRSAYIVTREGAHKLIEGFKQVEMHGDLQIAEMEKQGRLRIVSSREQLVSNEGQLKSDYQGERFPSLIYPPPDRRPAVGEKPTAAG